MLYFDILAKYRHNAAVTADEANEDIDVAKERRRVENKTDNEDVLTVHGLTKVHYIRTHSRESQVN